jgi:hypothetical protein
MKSRAADKRQIAKRAAAQKCTRCGKNPREGKAYCQKCADQIEVVSPLILLHLSSTDVLAAQPQEGR